MRRKAGTLCMILGAALVLAALSLFLWNQRENQKAGDVAADVLTQLGDIIEENQSVDDTEESYPDPYDTEMTEVEIDGYAYVGYISIPSLGLELPVMSDWSYPQLKISPCRFSGSSKTDDLVICAHNYTRHFGPIKNLIVGDAMYFTDMDGVTIAYQVAEIDILSPASIEDMTDSGYPLTLFTCTYGGASRVTVRCERIKDENN